MKTEISKHAEIIITTINLKISKYIVDTNTFYTSSGHEYITENSSRLLTITEKQQTI